MKDCDIETRARHALAQMTTDELRRSLAAFPRHVSVGCFLGYAYQRPGEMLCHGYDRGRHSGDGVLLEELYEQHRGAEWTDWLHGEVLRELAERGATPEVPLPVPELASAEHGS
jgi:hypothetical protein